MLPLIKLSRSAEEVHCNVNANSFLLQLRSDLINVIKFQPNLLLQPDVIEDNHQNREAKAEFITNYIENVVAVKHDYYNNSSCSGSTKSSTRDKTNGTNSHTDTTTTTKTDSIISDSDDDALPELKDNDIIFLLDYPKNCVRDEKIKAPEIPLKFEVGHLFALYLSEMYSPFKFWFHMQHDVQQLHDLMFDIQEDYKHLSMDDMRMRRSSIRIGNYCIALYDNLWHRAKILELPKSHCTNQYFVKLFYIDYGTVASVNVNHLKFMYTRYLDVPYLVHRGCIDNIKPIDSCFNVNTSSVVMNRFKNIMLHANITDINRKDNILYMVLTETNALKDIEINDFLIKRKYAHKFNCKIGEHHPSEEYPSFDKLENGLHPIYY